jgi:4-amino-4-deoxy-L-arabinose transferase-like glycosyltransferase
MVLFGLAGRLLYIVIARTYRLGPLDWPLFEEANLGRSLATGHGFSNPYGFDTGPSAWTAPVYPWVVSLAFRGLGVFSYAAGFAILAFNSVFSALTSWIIYRTARSVFSETVAICSGWVWVFWPWAILYSAVWIWDTCLSVFLLSLLFMLTLQMEGDGRLSSWFGYGLGWGILGLTNPSTLAWLPFSGCWLAYQLHRRGKRFLVPAAFGAAIFFVTLTPWLVRNYRVFGEPVLIRGDFGSEFRAGNNPLAEGWLIGAYHGSAKLTLFKQMGEAAFNAEQADEAREWIAQNPKRFVVLCFHRFIYFWAGLPRTRLGLPVTGLKRVKNLMFLTSSLLGVGGLVLAFKGHIKGVWLFATLWLFYPLTYYISCTEPRYRHALDPELVILSVFLLATLWRRLQTTGQYRTVHRAPLAAQG